MIDKPTDQLTDRQTSGPTNAALLFTHRLFFIHLFSSFFFTENDGFRLVLYVAQSLSHELSKTDFSPTEAQIQALIGWTSSPFLIGDGPYALTCQYDEAKSSNFRPGNATASFAELAAFCLLPLPFPLPLPSPFLFRCVHTSL